MLAVKLSCIPAVKICAFLELEKNLYFSFKYYITAINQLWFYFRFFVDSTLSYFFPETVDPLRIFRNPFLILGAFVASVVVITATGFNDTSN